MVHSGPEIKPENAQPNSGNGAGANTPPPRGSKQKKDVNELDHEAFLSSVERSYRMSEAQSKFLRDFFDAMQNAHKLSFRVPETNSSKHTPEELFYRTSMKLNLVVEKSPGGTVFKSGENFIAASPSSIVFIPQTIASKGPDGKPVATPKKNAFGMEDAYAMVLTSLYNKTMGPGNGIRIDNASRREQALIQKAVERINETLPENERIKVVNPLKFPVMLFGADKPLLDGFMAPAKIPPARQPGAAPAQPEPPKAGPAPAPAASPDPVAPAPAPAQEEGLVTVDLRDEANKEKYFEQAMLLLKKEYDYLIIDYPTPATEEEQESHLYENLDAQLDHGYVHALIDPKTGEVKGVTAGTIYDDIKTAQATYIAPKENPELAQKLSNDTAEILLRERGVAARFIEIPKGAEGADERAVYEKAGAQRVPVSYEQPLEPGAGEDARIHNLDMYVVFADKNASTREKIETTKKHFEALTREYDPEIENPINKQQLEAYNNRLDAVLAASEPKAKQETPRDTIQAATDAARARIDNIFQEAAERTARNTRTIEAIMPGGGLHRHIHENLSELAVRENSIGTTKLGGMTHYVFEAPVKEDGLADDTRTKARFMVLNGQALIMGVDKNAHYGAYNDDSYTIERKAPPAAGAAPGSAPA